MDGQIRPGDVVVSRVNGTRDSYVIGTVVSGMAGQLMLRDALTTNGRKLAIGRAYTERQGDHRVWLFDGSAAAYVKAPDPGEALTLSGA
jgi:hypothetical protein